MHRNGKTQPSAGDMLTLPGMASESQKMASERAGMASELPGTPSQRRVAAFTVHASIARRLAAAQRAIDTVLGDHDLQIALAAYGFDAARMADGTALRDRAAHQRGTAGRFPLKPRVHINCRARHTIIAEAGRAPEPTRAQVVAQHGIAQQPP